MFSTPESLVDGIYEAALVPELWPGVLSGLSQASRSQDGILFTVDPATQVRWTASGCLVGLMTDFVAEGWMARNERPHRALQKGHAGFVADTDVFTPDEIEAEPMRLELSARHGVWWAAGHVVTVPTGDVLVIDIERTREQGPFTREDLALLDGYGSHLARAALLSSRLHLERARTMAETLQRVGLPGAVLDGRGRVMAANASLEALSAQIVPRAFGGVSLAHPPAEALLRDALAYLRRDDVVRSIAVPGAGEAPPLVLHVVPLRRAAHDLFTGAASVLVATAVAPAQPFDADLLHGLFDLTPGEARVARGLVSGQTLEEIASAACVSRETVRSQLKQVFSKTGVRRQAELVGMLARAAAVQPGRVDG